MELQRSWSDFKKWHYFNREAGFALDISRMLPDEEFLTRLEPRIQKALSSMEALERGEIANPDEKRMVGHYWLRDSSRAPNAEIRGEIEKTLLSIKQFAASVHGGTVAPPAGGVFESLLVIGIGGSALGPQFVHQALMTGREKLRVFFFDNTDPDGMARTIQQIPDLKKALCVVISKSGGTKETRNGQLVAKQAWQRAGCNFAKHFIAVTGVGSELDQTAVREGWLQRFPMWDWVGGRTSELSAVGLLPAALQGYEIEELLRGAAEMDALTRDSSWRQNPAALLALMWYQVGEGRGAKDMVILPYKDRLEMLSRYLQQLVMESLGKEHDLDGNTVHQGIAVYGNKGSTDQHAFVQQLRDGVPNFFVIFIEALKDHFVSAGAPSAIDSETAALHVEPGVTCGDYLTGFYLGTRSALFEKGRRSCSITISEVSARNIGMIIALFERAVGLYASLVNINAYHQPGVEAGKRAAAAVLSLQDVVLKHLRANKGAYDVEQIANAIKSEDREVIYKVLRHLGANGGVIIEPGKTVFEDRYRVQ